MVAIVRAGGWARRGFVTERDRWRAVAAVAVVHLALAYALLSGLSVQIQQTAAAVTQLIAVQLAPPVPVVAVEPRERAVLQSAAPAAAPDRPGGSTGPSAARASNPVAPITVAAPTVSPGGIAGQGTLAGTGSGGGSGGQGSGTGAGNGAGNGAGGGTDLEWIKGEIRPSDYPRSARDAGIGGRVEFRFTVGVRGRVTDCTVTRSSGHAALDETTCRVVMKRFRYRPGTNAAGRPVPAEVEGDHLWTTNRFEADQPE